MSTQFFEGGEIEVSQGILCPSVNIEKSRADENEVKITDDQRIAAKYGLDGEHDIAAMSTRLIYSEMEGKAEEARKELEEAKKQFDLERRRKKRRRRREKKKERERRRTTKNSSKGRKRQLCLSA